MTQMHIEHFGHLKKVEMLTTLQNLDLGGKLVLEAPEPFPGCSTYYGETPRKSVPLYVYFILSSGVDLEKFIRANQQVAETFGEAFNGAYASIEISNEKFRAIRVRHLKDYALIKPLLDAYIEAGLEFAKGNKRYEGSALITIKKLFQLNWFDDGFYCDDEEPDHGYFEVPSGMNQKEFDALIRHVKNNTNLQLYDFARAFFYTKQKVVDVIRVYNPEMNQNLVRFISEEVLARV